MFTVHFIHSEVVLSLLHWLHILYAHVQTRTRPYSVPLSDSSSTPPKELMFMFYACVVFAVVFLFAQSVDVG